MAIIPGLLAVAGCSLAIPSRSHPVGGRSRIEPVARLLPELGAPVSSLGAVVLLIGDPIALLASAVSVFGSPILVMACLASGLGPVIRFPGRAAAIITHPTMVPHFVLLVTRLAWPG